MNPCGKLADSENINVCLHVNRVLMLRVRRVAWRHRNLLVHFDCVGSVFTLDQVSQIAEPGHVQLCLCNPKHTGEMPSHQFLLKCHILVSSWGRGRESGEEEEE